VYRQNAPTTAGPRAAGFVAALLAAAMLAWSPQVAPAAASALASAEVVLPTSVLERLASLPVAIGAIPGSVIIRIASAMPPRGAPGAEGLPSPGGGASLEETDGATIGVADGTLGSGMVSAISVSAAAAGAPSDGGPSRLTVAFN
jgi:hypothetical protein